MVYERFAMSLRDVAILFPSFMFVLTFRGFFRALVAKWMGDETPYQYGFLSLNPIVHIDVIGLSVILLLIFLIGGLFGGGIHSGILYIFLIMIGVRWSYQVPVESRNFKYFKFGVIFTLLSRAIACFILALFFMYLLRYFPWGSLKINVAKSLLEITGTVIDLSVYFGVLALLPLPPFDGWGLVQFLVPYSKQNFVNWVEENSFIIFLILFFLPIVSDSFFAIIGYVVSLVKALLYFCVI